MLRHVTLSIVLISVLFTHVYGNCGKPGEVVEQMEKGTIDWTRGLLQAKGTGSPDGKNSGKNPTSPIEAARDDALRNLLKVVKKVRIDSQKTVGEISSGSDTIETEIVNLVQTAKLMEPVKYLSDRSVEVTTEMSLYGGLAQLILPPDIKHVESIKPVKLKKQPVEADSEKNPAEKSLTEDSKIYTGLIVDARGLSIKPAMAPRILDESNREVYGPAFVSREFVVQQGMGGYVKNIRTAQNCKRVNDRPLIVKGLRAIGPAYSDIVICDADASRIRSASEHLLFMKKCRVVIVVD